MLFTAAFVFLYYSTWALAMVINPRLEYPAHTQPFVDEGHVLHSYFPPRAYAIRIPVILLILGLTVVSSFLALVMIKSARSKRKAPKAA